MGSSTAEAAAMPTDILPGRFGAKADLAIMALAALPEMNGNPLCDARQGTRQFGDNRQSVNPR
jgi:hypothetical protein